MWPTFHMVHRLLHEMLHVPKSKLQHEKAHSTATMALTVQYGGMSNVTLDIQVNISHL